MRKRVGWNSCHRIVGGRSDGTSVLRGEQAKRLTIPITTLFDPGFVQCDNKSHSNSSSFLQTLCSNP